MGKRRPSVTITSVPVKDFGSGLFGEGSVCSGSTHIGRSISCYGIAAISQYVVVRSEKHLAAQLCAHAAKSVLAKGFGLPG